MASLKSVYVGNNAASSLKSIGKNANDKELSVTGSVSGSVSLV